MEQSLVRKLLTVGLFTLPITYIIATVYVPYNLSPSMYNETSKEITEYVEKAEPVTLREISENTEASFFQTWYISSKLSKKKTLVKCPEGIKAASCRSVQQRIPT